MQKTNAGPQQVEILENRVLFSTINVASFGATPNDNGDDRSAIQAAINAAGSGDTVVFNDGTYKVSGNVSLKNGINVTGQSVGGTLLDFNVGIGGAQLTPNNFAFRTPRDVSDLSFTKLKVKSNNGIFFMEGSRNVAFTDNDFQWGYNGSYYNRLAFYSGYSQDNMKIERNYFHDSPNSDRNVEIWGMKNSSYSYNRFYMIHDGGHIMEPTSNVQLSFNRGEKIHRMGMEVQGNTPTTNLTVEGNVFTNWDRPWNDTFGLSIMMMNSPSTRIINNYMRADFEGDWGVSQPGVGGPRFGLAIEAGFNGGEVSGNIIGGPRSWAAGVAASQANTPVRNNKFYGSALWYWVMGQPGNNGNGSVVEENNLREPNASLMPAPPTITPPGAPAPAPAPTPNPTPDPIPVPVPVPVPTGPKLGVPTSGVLTPTAGPRYLSDLTWTNATNGWGPVERDRSNGEQGANDGRQLTIGGQQYNKGLGVHTDSTITYNIARGYSTFISDVGIDDEVGNLGSAIFEVWGDGRKLFSTQKIKGSDGAKTIQVDVRGITELKLVTTHSGDGVHEDHADWGNARIQ